MVAALSYVLGWITGIIVLFWRGRHDTFVRFHALQSILVFAALSIVWVVIKAIFALPLLGTVLGCVLGPLLGVLTLLLWSGLILLALLGRRVKIPLLGDWAESLARAW
jgi:uncharacterized membrane protein